MPKTVVLFLRSGNSARSQMAEGFLRELGGDRFEAHNAGLDPIGVNPLAVEVMREVGIDISGQRSKSLAVAEYSVGDITTVQAGIEQQLAQTPEHLGSPNTWASRLHTT